MKLKEYLREIELMNQQYGHEEELYPLVDRLLRNGDNMADLSLRTVAKGRSMKSTDSSRKFLKQYSSFPDLVILDEKFDKTGGKEQIDYIYGCVECKKIFDSMLELKNMAVECRDIVYLKEKDKGNAQYWTTCAIDRNKINGEKKGKKVANIYETFSDFNGIGKITDIREKDENRRKNPLIWYKFSKSEEKHGEKIGTNKKLTMGNKDIEIRIDLNQIVVKFEGEEAKIATGDDLMQLVGEVLWYGKVLYTNGFKWNYIHCTGCSMKNENEELKSVEDLRTEMIKQQEEMRKQPEKQDDAAWWIEYVEKNIRLIYIECTEIDLSSCYEHYKENKQLEQADFESWYKLKYELEKIVWKSDASTDNFYKNSI